jgi:hypothetical protein
LCVLLVLLTDSPISEPLLARFEVLSVNGAASTGSAGAAAPALDTGDSKTGGAAGAEERKSDGFAAKVVAGGGAAAAGKGM